ncbi:MAG TPA: class I adenylate-forming enzyme family protein [Sphingobium sp.]
MSHGSEQKVLESTQYRPNIRDPLVERLIGPGKPFALETVLVNGHPRQQFVGAARNLAGLYRQAMAYPNRLMVVQDALRLTYAEGFARAAALAAALTADFAVTPGTPVAVVMSNRAEWLIATLAITAVGGVPALVNSRGTAEEMLRAIATVDCRLAILDAERADCIAAENPDPAWSRIVIAGGTTPLRSDRDGDFAELSAPRSDIAFDPVDLDPEAGGVILFTSGTTGFPKGALLSQRALAHSVAISCFMGTLQDLRYEEENGEAVPEDRQSMRTPAVILGPLFHLAGIMPAFRAISLGTTIHIMTKWNVDIAFDMIEKVGMTRLSFVPAMLWDMLRSPRATPDLLGQVRYMANGAAALNPTLLAEVQERMPQCIISNTYGQTETTSWTCSISGQSYLDHSASCGWAAPTVDVSVRRDDGSEADIGEPGELWVSSAGLLTEYVGDAKATGEALQQGWLASGDIGIVNEEGIFTIVDRKKNMVISGGENIYCAEIERVLADHSDVSDCIAYGLPDERLGERLAVTIVVPPDTGLTSDAVKSYCKERLAIYKVPREVILVNEPLPRTASGKVDRGAFLRRLRDGG